jgi:hypothetical protein
MAGGSGTQKGFRPQKGLQRQTGKSPATRHLAYCRPLAGIFFFDLDLGFFELYHSEN